MIRGYLVCIWEERDTYETRIRVNASGKKETRLRHVSLYINTRRIDKYATR